MAIKHRCPIGFAIKNTATLMQNSFNNLLKPYGIAGEQFTLLRLIEQNPDSSQQEIAEFLVKNKTTVTKMLDVLEGKGIVERKRDVKDRRTFRILITEKGNGLLEEVANVIEPKLELFNAMFSEEEIRVFESVIGKCQEFTRKELS